MTSTTAHRAFNATLYAYNHTMALRNLITDSEDPLDRLNEYELRHLLDMTAVMIYRIGLCLDFEEESDDFRELVGPHRGLSNLAGDFPGQEPADIG